MTKQAKPMMGAQISDGGHGSYPADIIAVGDVFVIVGNPDWGGIKYGPGKRPASHEIREFPQRPYINKQRGIVVVPKGQLAVLRDLK